MRLMHRIIRELAHDTARLFHSKASKDAIFLVFEKLIRVPLNLLISIFLARSFGPTGFGELSLLLTLVGIFSTIAAFGLPGIVVTELVSRPKELRVTVNAALFVRSITGIVFYLLYVATAFVALPKATGSHASPVVYILGLQIITLSSDVFSWILESAQRFKDLIIIRSSAFIVFSALKLLSLIYYPSVLAFSLFVAIESSMVLGIHAINYFRKHPILIRLRPMLYESNALIKKSFPLLLTGLSVVVYMGADQLMLSAMQGDEEVGIYSAASRLVEILYFPAIAIASATYPSILRLRVENTNLYRKKFGALFLVLARISVLLGTLTITFSGVIIHTLYGSAFERSNIILAVISSGIVFVYMNVAASKLYLAENKQYISLYLTATGATANILLNLILIPSWQAVGAAIATLTSQIIVFAAPLILLRAPLNPLPYVTGVLNRKDLFNSASH